MKDVKKFFNALNYVKNLKITIFYSAEELLEKTKKIEFDYN